MKIEENDIKLSFSQIDSLYGLCTKNNNCKVNLNQTYTKSGGTHLYVRIKSKEYHIAKSGNIQEIEIGRSI